MTKPRPNRAATVRCVVCGLEITGVVDEMGVVRPSDVSRPAPNQPVRDGWCLRHAATVSERAATPPEGDTDTEAAPVKDVVTILRRYFQATDTTGRSHDWWMLRAEEVTKALRAQPDLAALRSAVARTRLSVRFTDRRTGEDMTTDDIVRLISDAPESPE